MDIVKSIDPRLEDISDCLYRLAVKAVIVSAHKILLVKEEDDEWWSLPGGGIDHGEDIAQALVRELAEELGVDGADIQTDGKILLVNVGAVVDGIPKANLLYRVNVPAEKVKPTRHVAQSGWFISAELPELYLSPSTGDIKAQLAEIIEAG